MRAKGSGKDCQPLNEGGQERGEHANRQDKIIAETKNKKKASGGNASEDGR